MLKIIENNKKNIEDSYKKTLKNIKSLLPILFGVLLLVSLFNNSIYINNILQNLEDNFVSVIISNIIASISAGNAINSYIIADTIGNLNDNIKIISTFLIAWATVGFLQIPMEISYFGKRFALIRNLLSFIFATLGGYLVYFLMKI